MSHTNVSFSEKKASEYIWNGDWLWQGRPSGGGLRQRWSAGPYLALSVFIWHYYSPGNKFWHVKISDNNDIKFNQWRLFSPTSSLGAQQLRPLIVPKSKPMGFCIIVQQKWPGVKSWVVAVQLYGVNVNGGIKQRFIKYCSSDILPNRVGTWLFITAACPCGIGGPSHCCCWTKHLCSAKNFKVVQQVERITDTHNRACKLSLQTQENVFYSSGAACFTVPLKLPLWRFSGFMMLNQSSSLYGGFINLHVYSRFLSWCHQKLGHPDTINWNHTDDHHSTKYL